MDRGGAPPLVLATFQTPPPSTCSSVTPFTPQTTATAGAPNASVAQARSWQPAEVFFALGAPRPAAAVQSKSVAM